MPNVRAVVKCILQMPPVAQCGIRRQSKAQGQAGGTVQVSEDSAD